MAGPLRDTDIRAAVHADLQRRYGGDPDTLVRNELGLSAGQRRVDVAVVNGELTGYEIKSDVDTLARLEGQAEACSRVFDRMSIVTTDRYLTAASELVPSWWGVIRASSDEGAGELEAVRAPRPNPEPDAFSIVQLLWREEALEELRHRGLARGLSNKRRWIIWQHLTAALSLDEVQSLVRTRLRQRQDWSGGG